MGRYFEVIVLNENGKIHKRSNYRCKGCAKNHIHPKKPTCIKNHRGQIVLYNSAYKHLAQKEGWKLAGQEVKK